MARIHRLIYVKIERARCAIVRRMPMAHNDVTARDLQRAGRRGWARERRGTETSNTFQEARE
jgi:hypothetical protein